MCLVAMVFCAFQCDSYSTRFYVMNNTEETVVIDSYVGRGKYDPKKARILPGESLEIHSEDARVNFYVIDHRHVSMYSTDGTLLRFWTTYYKTDNLDTALVDCNARFFRKYGVRQFHDENEWEYVEYKDRCKWIFNILPEDQTPLSEFVDNKAK